MIPEEGDIEIYSLEDRLTLRTLLQSWCMDDCICCLEQVASSPQMGVKSAFSFGNNFGYIQAMLDAFFIPRQEIIPSRWKGEFSLNLGKSATDKQKKEADIRKCRELYPKVSLRKTPRCRVDDNNYADALLLATYAKRKF